ncbi:MAG: amidohydrolase family protein [Clostridia bacterium]|nr:amidohydrolase family protein [Clostridia bacterium]
MDFHVHNHIHTTPEEAAVYMKEMIDRLGYEGIGIMASLHSSRGPYPTSNEDAMALVKLLPGSIAFAGLDHERDFVEQTKEYMEAGFKGIKLLEGKPSEWRYRGYGYEHPRFDAFFDYCEKEGIPLLIHNNDPLANWDLSKADERAIKMGWVYDENVPSQEWFFEQLEHRLLTHPNLRAAIAHFGFYSNDIPRAERLMEACPNLVMDITPAILIYPQLSETPEAAEAFFRKYHTRIIYGTDADTKLEGFAREYNDKKRAIITHFLEGDEPREIAGNLIHPIKLEREMLENIYYNNAMRFIER